MASAEFAAVWRRVMPSSFVWIDTNSLSLANFVGIVVGFLNVLLIRLRSLLLAAALSFEIELV
jgi:hypothetical protein